MPRGARHPTDRQGGMRRGDATEHNLCANPADKLLRSRSASRFRMPVRSIGLSFRLGGEGGGGEGAPLAQVGDGCRQPIATDASAWQGDDGRGKRIDREAVTEEGGGKRR